jgi:hypothetical protein
LEYKKERGGWILYAEVPDENVNAGWQRLLTAQNSGTRPEHDEDFDGGITLTMTSMSMEEGKVYYGICRKTHNLECGPAKFSSKKLFTSFATLSAYWKRNE